MSLRYLPLWDSEISFWVEQGNHMTKPLQTEGRGSWTEKVLQEKLVEREGVKCLGMERQIIKRSKRRGIGKRINQRWKHDQEKEGDNASKRKWSKETIKPGGFGICSQKQSRKQKYKGELEGEAKQKSRVKLVDYENVKVPLPKRAHKKYPVTEELWTSIFILARTWLIVEVAKTVSKREFAELKGGSQSFQNDTGTSSFTTSF